MPFYEAVRVWNEARRGVRKRGMVVSMWWRIRSNRVEVSKIRKCKGQLVAMAYLLGLGCSTR